MECEKFLEEGNKVEDKRLFGAGANKRRTKDEQKMNKRRTKDEQKTNKRRTNDEQMTNK
ncbi:hypothetical protein Coch_0266 [Capnocytophaga ochracea DSM 7271]|uniref:Uncharacterized protein n=1 Tax=Capnocytophaga ochracea (strain ATCC 27872 / DSM 7271 / CCUG 9716 / JCM 12966 / NCTC 12371 / SS31 / VPI 2845) TaxID=521097 RepID=C7M5L9_CAPOD|nr:hypothetical protein [Capnocytophaga ochracea]ACU91829.1 hypothetical protein Coch_0266 [Capnocytophaga ochracea DSM 7271]UAK50602.1 hypothetical protein K8O87_07480 [Capnocytophaga ochracea]